MKGRFILLVFAFAGLVLLGNEEASAQCFLFFPGGDAVEIPCPPNEESPPPDNPLADEDDDGVANNVDNCPFAHNPDQADTWGDTRGDACDTSGVVDNHNGTKAFYNRDAQEWDVYGDCHPAPEGRTQCWHLGRLDYCELPTTLLESTYVDNPSEGLTDRRVLVTLTGSSITGVRDYQINIHDANGVDVQIPFSIEFPGKLCSTPDIDTDSYVGEADYCPEQNGPIHGCADLASYFTYVNIAFGYDFSTENMALHLDPNGDSDGDGILNQYDPQQFIANTSTNNNNSGGCGPGGVDVVVGVDNSGNCGGGDAGPQVTTRFIDEAYCNAVFYWHSVCLAYATGIAHWDDYPAPYQVISPNWSSIADACQESLNEGDVAGICEISVIEYCRALPEAC